MSNDELVEAVCRPHTDLYLFGQIQALCENSSFSPASHRAEQQIVRICKREMQRCLRAYDREAARLAAKAARR